MRQDTIASKSVQVLKDDYLLQLIVFSFSSTLHLHPLFLRLPLGFSTQFFIRYRTGCSGEKRGNSFRYPDVIE